MIYHDLPLSKIWFPSSQTDKFTKLPGHLSALPVSYLAPWWIIILLGLDPYHVTRRYPRVNSLYRCGKSTMKVDDVPGASSYAYPRIYMLEIPGATTVSTWNHPQDCFWDRLSRKVSRMFTNLKVTWLEVCCFQTPYILNCQNARIRPAAKALRIESAPSSHTAKLYRPSLELSQNSGAWKCDAGSLTIDILLDKLGCLQILGQILNTRALLGLMLNDPQKIAVLIRICRQFCVRFLQWSHSWKLAQGVAPLLKACHTSWKWKLLLIRSRHHWQLACRNIMARRNHTCRQGPRLTIVLRDCQQLIITITVALARICHSSRNTGIAQLRGISWLNSKLIHAHHDLLHQLKLFGWHGFSRHLMRHGWYEKRSKAQATRIEVKADTSAKSFTAPENLRLRSVGKTVTKTCIAVLNSQTFEASASFQANGYVSLPARLPHSRCAKPYTAT